MADVVKFGSAAMLGGQETGQPGLFGMGENSVIARVTFILLDDSNKEKFDKAVVDSRLPFPQMVIRQSRGRLNFNFT